MKLIDVWNEMAARLATIPELRVYARPVGKIDIPAHGAAAIIPYPQAVDFDLTYGRGSDELDQAVVVAIGNPESERTATRLAAFIDGGGGTSIKEVLEPTGYTSCDRVVVERAEFDVYTMAGTPVMVAIFYCKIIGDGVTA